MDISFYNTNDHTATRGLEESSYREIFAGKRVVDGELEENGVEPVEGNSKLYTKVRIMVELDDGEPLIPRFLLRGMPVDLEILR
ncbi:hypothetical protein JT359_04870 [Candidatus Poribacteria bacterium]|nr:hypothetical protein [Candidatus Poribacteria bacterium]